MERGQTIDLKRPDEETSAPLLTPAVTARLFIIGLLGGVAAGKSTVAHVLKQWGARHIDADAIAHRVLQLPAVRRKICAAWGTQLEVRGQIDRQALAREVFGAPHKRRLLESWIHPLVRQEIIQQLQDLAAQGRQVVVLDIPLLARSVWLSLCNLVLFVDTPLALREQRARERGWPVGEIARREAHQVPLAEKRSMAHCIVDNSSSLSTLQSRLAHIWHTQVPVEFQKIAKDKNNRAT